MEHIKTYIDYIAIFVESIGVLTMLIGIVIATVRYVSKRNTSDKSPYIVLRQDIGKSIFTRSRNTHCSGYYCNSGNRTDIEVRFHFRTNRAY